MIGLNRSSIFGDTFFQPALMTVRGPWPVVGPDTHGPLARFNDNTAPHPSSQPVTIALSLLSEALWAE